MGNLINTYFRTHHHLCRQGVALAGPRQLRSQGPVSVHAHCTEGVTGSEAREGANGFGVEIRVNGGNGDVNGDVDGAGTGVEASERTQDGNGDGSGEGAGTGTGTGVETRGRTQDGNGSGSGDRNERSSGDGNGDGIGDGKRNENGEEGGEKETSGFRHIKKEAESKTRH